MNYLDLVVEPLQYTFMARALITTVVAAVVCALLSCWLVLIGWSLVGDAVSHAVLPGVVLAYIFGLPFALGLVLISVTPSHTDLNHIIFGNILGVSKQDLLQIGILAAIAFVVLIAGRRTFTVYAFDPMHAHTIGLKPRRVGAALFAMLALTCVVALQVVGVILVVAMLIVPGATAYLLTDRFSRMLVIAPVMSGACSVVGIYLSYFLDASPGGLVVLVQGIVIAAVYLFSPTHGVVASRLLPWVHRRSRASKQTAR